MASPERYAAAVSRQYASFLSRITSAWLIGRDAGASLYSMQALRTTGASATTVLIRHVRLLDEENVDFLPGGVAPEAMRAFLDALNAIAVHNVAMLVANLGGAPTLSSVMSEVSGAFSALLRRRASAPAFTAEDSAGRRWPANKLVAFLARDMAYNAMIDFQARSIAAQGVPAQVVYSDPLHRYFGSLLSVDGSDAALPSLASQRAVVFHPNSRAELRAYRESLHVSR